MLADGMAWLEACRNWPGPGRTAGAITGSVTHSAAIAILPHQQEAWFCNLKKTRITKEEALNFLLTHIVVECDTPIQLDQLTLFKLSNLARLAVEEINSTEGIIPHEVIEAHAREYLDQP